MRPHTRTQCQDGNQCPECIEPPHSGSVAGPASTSASTAASASSTGHSGTPTTSDPFVAPTGTVSRVSRLTSLTAANRSLLSTSANSTSSAISQANLSDAEKRAMLFIELPAEILFKILSYMSFKEISHLRMVSFPLLLFWLDFFCVWKWCVITEFLFTIYLSLLSFRKFFYDASSKFSHTKDFLIYCVLRLFMTIFIFVIRYLDASMKFVPQCSTALFNVFKAKCCRGFKRSKLRCLVGNRPEGKIMQ